MKLTSLLKGLEEATIKLSKNQLCSVRGKTIQIRCLSGDLWITWPNRGEKILKGGQTHRVSSRGKVCVVALTDAYFKMSKRRWGVDSQIHRESGATMREADIFKFPVETPGTLAF